MLVRLLSGHCPFLSNTISKHRSTFWKRWTSIYTLRSLRTIYGFSTRYTPSSGALLRPVKTLGMVALMSPQCTRIGVSRTMIATPTSHGNGVAAWFLKPERSVLWVVVREVSRKVRRFSTTIATSICLCNNAGNGQGVV
ncbi:Uncharacterized protein HZ326_2427 [Fusarium oxysporum f. sp. albedinis]|nr:Uncharacterized protein HZ326_2427 [Fusarium oxysporum f. sp. albedinis]